MSKREPKIIELPYMGPPTNKDKEEDKKQYERTMPVSIGSRRTMPVPPHVRDRDYAQGGKVKKYADGGMTQQPTYPFYGNQPQAGGQNGGTNQTFNMQPQATAGTTDQQQPMQTFKKGGKVSMNSKVKKMALGGMGSRPAPARTMPAKPMPPQVGSLPPPLPPHLKGLLGNTISKPYVMQPGDKLGTAKPSPPMSPAMSAMPKAFMKKGGSVKASKMGAVKQSKPSMGSASSRGDGIAQRGKTKGRMV